jgi:hypothetical protein
LPSAISVTSLAGDGSSLTSLNASNISSGKLGTEINGPFLSSGISKNLIKQSEDFGNGSAWQNFAATINSNFAVAPNGLQVADKITINSTTNPVLRQSSILTVSQTYKFELWIRHVSGPTSLFIDFGDGAAYNIGTSSTSWVKRSVTGTANNTFLDISGNSGSVFEVWGAHLHLSSESPNYIKTLATSINDIPVVAPTTPFRAANFSTTEKNAITNLSNGIILYDSTLNKLQVYENGAWANIV